jgi:hypothetical protein
VINLGGLDIRMALPAPPASATVLGHLPAWSEGLEAVGVSLRAPGATPPADLTVASASQVEEALAGGSPMLILQGSASRRPLRRSGFSVRSCLPVPRGNTPDLLLPLHEHRPTAYALSRLRPPHSRIGRLRNAGAVTALALGVVPHLRDVQTVVTRGNARPFLLEAARACGLPADATWLQTLGRGDALTRGVFYVFSPRATVPGWVVKFSRIPGHPAAFAADERGLGLVAQTSPAVSAHAPRLLGRFNVGGFEASAESALVGQTLAHALTGPAPRGHRLGLLDRVAAWTIEMARATAAPPAQLQAERHRLTEDVLAQWVTRGAPLDLVSRLPLLPAVLTHNDLGSWNIVVDGDDFGVADWESARAHGLPLWDLLYFAVDALALFGGARTGAERVEQSVQMLRGTHAESQRLFGWVQRAARSSGVPEDAVGALATLCWLHHGLSHVTRWSAAESAQPGSGTFIPPVEQIAARWVADPALGPDWPAWRAYCLGGRVAP